MRQTTGLSAARHLDAALGLGLFLKELERPGLKHRLARCVQPGLFLAALLELGNIATAVKQVDLAALLGHFARSALVFLTSTVWSAFITTPQRLAP